MIKLSEMEEDLIDKIRSLKNDIDNTSSAFNYYSDQYYRANNSDDAASYRNRMEEAISMLRLVLKVFQVVEFLMIESISLRSISRWVIPPFFFIQYSFLLLKNLLPCMIPPLYISIKLICIGL